MWLFSSVSDIRIKYRKVISKIMKFVIIIRTLFLFVKVTKSRRHKPPRRQVVLSLSAVSN